MTEPDEEFVPIRASTAVNLATFTPCCMVCTQMFWTADQGLFCSLAEPNKDPGHNYSIGWAMVCDHFERIETWAQVGGA